MESVNIEAPVSKKQEHSSASSSNAANTNTAPQPEIKITRATMALRIEPWRLLDSKEKRDVHASKQCGGSDKGCVACLLSAALFSAQRECAGAANMIARNCERMDGASWDEALLKAAGGRVELPSKSKTLENGNTVKSVVWPSDGWNAYQAARQAYPNTLSGIMSCVANNVVMKWRKERMAVLAKMERSAARYKSATASVPLRAADCRLVETDNRDEFMLECSLRSGRSPTKSGKQFSIPIRAKDQRQYNTLREIAKYCSSDPEAKSKMGEIEIKRDRKSRHWEMRIAYTRKVELVKGDKLAAINRGIACMVAVTTEEGESIIYDGNAIVAYLKQIQARRQKIQREYKLSGRKGRGRGKALAPLRALEDKAMRWRQTRLQTMAREISNWLAARGITKLLMEDLTGIRHGNPELLDGGKYVWDMLQEWPYYQLGQRLSACCDERGIQTEKREAHFISRDCPKCEHRNEERPLARMFVCDSCGFKRHTDVSAGMVEIVRERTRDVT